MVSECLKSFSHSFSILFRVVGIENLLLVLITNQTAPLFIKLSQNLTVSQGLGIGARDRRAQVKWTRITEHCIYQSYQTSLKCWLDTYAGLILFKSKLLLKGIGIYFKVFFLDEFDLSCKMLLLI